MGAVRLRLRLSGGRATLPRVDDPKTALHGALQRGREAVLWKLEGLDEYDARRPMTPTATNLLGLVKHLAFVEIAYFGDTFGRPLPGAPRWPDLGDDFNADMWATADESRAGIVDAYRRAADHADETITTLPLDATGEVGHWPADRNPVTLHAILVHVVAETQRHAGHADIVRELIDGEVGMRLGNDNIPPAEAARWSSYRDAVARAARDAADRPRGGSVP